MFASIGAGAGSRLRALVFTGAALAALCAPLAVNLGPAHAGGWDDSGPGSGSAGTGGTATQNPGNFECRGAQLYSKSSGDKWYDGPYPNCLSSAYQRTSKITLCPVGFQVFRFYGTYADPSKAYTVSDLQLTRPARRPVAPGTAASRTTRAAST
jgi:hypothetical protein